MAQKSKTQRAKASAARAERKEEKARQAAEEALKPAVVEEPEPAKKSLFSKKETKVDAATLSKEKKAEKVEDKKPKKKRFQFLRDVRAEMKRVTWPTRQDVVRWSGVVIGALLFFGIYVAILDNLIISPLLVAISGLGA